MTALALDGRVAVVTGGGKGLGRAFALHLAELGAAVVVNNRHRVVDADGLSAADHVAREITDAGGRAVADHGDVADHGTGPALVATALDAFGRLDICVTSAGISSPQMFHRTTAENFEHVMAVNVTGTALVAAAASAHMREAGFGRIVMIASAAGLHGEPTVSAYAASKGAVIALARTVAAEGERRGVLTNVLLPYAHTQMTQEGMDPAHTDAMRSELVAPVVGALVDPACTLNGEVIVAGGTGLRSADAVEHGTVRLPDGPLAPADLAELLATSRSGPDHRYGHAQDAFLDLAADLA
ncbi:oxidoreductase, short chain dehydrogenase/reductase family protein [Aeromicrobium marinum DSM 15272]|uniref:Oxidoreductase, short chain dehydrogenase/reductase family protein n=1 Tax=Aeromicrobium marinum DSM 15272 TaxID=585531 RepID=E2S7X8_9ACTN|nr:SDR family NAD(P)-dependent oxidoreductase [Aeromicrobium marinum]EFQ84794.1 oxidoreductase, short chain dehydrogenase/reductase family protein [Aeromicrobium marinum DSM 15272]